MIIFNHDKLEARIIEKFGDFETFGNHVGMSKDKVNTRVRGTIHLKESEIENFVNVLDIQPNQIQEYFFDVEAIR